MAWYGMAATSEILQLSSVSEAIVFDYQFLPQLHCGCSVAARPGNCALTPGDVAADGSLLFSASYRPRNKEQEENEIFGAKKTTWKSFSYLCPSRRKGRGVGSSQK